MELKASPEPKASCSGPDGTIASLPSLSCNMEKGIPLLLMTPRPWSLYAWSLPVWKVSFHLSVKGKLPLGRDLLS